MTRAIIIGGSIAGSLAAAAIHPHVDEVVVLDRDDLPSGPERRRGAPHGRHIHTLLASSLVALEGFFPGFTEDAVEQGCHLVSFTENVKLHQRHGWAPRVASDGLTTLMASRPMIEHLIRARVRALNGVQFRTGTVVRGLRSSADGTAVTGVVLDRGEELAADLVVDACGRSSSAPDWLEALGYPRPTETVINARYGYASCNARARGSFKPDYDGLGLGPLGSGPHGIRSTRGVTIWRLEGPDRWIVTAIGSSGDLPPADDEGFLAFLGSLPQPEVAEALAGLELELPAVSWTRTANRLRHYDQLGRRPEGFILLGDSVAAFNPVYGQGITVASVSAAELANELDERRRDGVGLTDGLAEKFQERIMSVIDFPWSISTQADYRQEGTEGPPLSEEAVSSMAFFDRLEAVSGEDPSVFVKMMETFQLVRTGEWIQDETLQKYIADNWDRLGAAVACD